MMIENIEDAESLASVRTKLNAMLAKTNARRDYIRGAGRFYANTDLRWVTNSDDNYGTIYHQLNEPAGTGIDPIVEWEHQGDLVFPGQKVADFTMAGDANSGELQDFELSLVYKRPEPITRWKTGVDNDTEVNSVELYRGLWFNNTDADQPAFSGDMFDAHARVFPIAESLQTIPEIGYVSIYFKPISTTITATRYFSATYAWGLS